MKRQSSGRANYIGLVLGVAVSLLALLVVWQRDYVRDSFMLLQYAPSTEIAAISERSQLSSTGERYFYASHPEINATTEFSDLCENHEKSSVVLGCYTGAKIYLFAVDNEELDGIVEVTAAHEVLHAAYDRLSPGERERVNELLLKEDDRLSKSESFRERMSVYKDLSDAERTEELHSVIGTEIRVISPELEEYYKKTFDNRRKIVDLYEGYQSVFAELQTESKRLADSLDRQANEINQKTEAYNAQSEQLTKDIDAFNSRANSGGFDSQSEFDIQRAILVARAEQLELERAAINDAIDRYNEDKTKLDQLAGHLEELNSSIDSNLAPPPDVEG